MNRAVLEFVSKGSAGIIDETDDWYWVRVLNKFEMYVHKNDKSVTPCLVNDGFWESWITDYIIRQCTPGTVFFDVGANTGYYSMLAYFSGAMVWSFEPNPEYFNMLEATLERNGINTGMFRRTMKAISDKRGKETLYIPKELHGSASFTKLDAKWETHEIEVETIPLDFLNGAGKYIIKIDAEGAEEKIWDGMLESLRSRPAHTQVLLEYTPGAYSDEFIDKLEDYAPLRWINYDGEAERVDRDWLEAQTDWVMLVMQVAP